jgi:hypothetical protein
MTSAAIHFVCVAETHQERTRGGSYVSPLTINAGQWAYCPAGLMTDHTWHAITPTPVDDVRRNWRVASAAT